MKMSIILLNIFASSILCSYAQAEEWIPRLSCNGATLVVEGLHSFDNGFTAHRLVIRNPVAIAHFQSLVSVPLKLNAKGELAISSIGPKFNGNLNVELAQMPFRGAGTLFYYLRGRWLDGHRYEVGVNSNSCTPGSCGPPPGTTIGNWIFNECQPR